MNVVRLPARNCTKISLEPLSLSFAAPLGHDSGAAVDNPFFSATLAVSHCVLLVRSCTNVCYAQEYLDRVWWSKYPLFGELAVGKRIRRTTATIEVVNRCVRCVMQHAVFDLAH